MVWRVFYFILGWDPLPLSHINGVSPSWTSWIFFFCWQTNTEKILCCWKSWMQVSYGLQGVTAIPVSLIINHNSASERTNYIRITSTVKFTKKGDWDLSKGGQPWEPLNNYLSLSSFISLFYARVGWQLFYLHAKARTFIIFLGSRSRERKGV